MYDRYLNDIEKCVYLAAAADYVILDPNWYDLSTRNLSSQGGTEAIR